MGYDPDAATAALRKLELARARLEQLIPHWPEVRPDDGLNVPEVLATLEALDEASAKLGEVLRAGANDQPATGTDYAAEVRYRR